MRAHDERASAEAGFVQGNAIACDTPAPTGHGETRRALSELRRVVYAVRNRIRRKLIRMRELVHGNGSKVSKPRRRPYGVRDEVVADALAGRRLAILFAGLGSKRTLGRRDLVGLTADADHPCPISEKDDEADDA